MSRTMRRDYLGEHKRDGDWCKKCPELNCPTCVNGKAKKTFRRWFRRTERRQRDD